MPKATAESAPTEMQNDESENTEARIPPKPKPRTKKATDLPVVERRNWLIHQHFIRKEFDSCKQLIKEQLTETGGECEYALYIQAVISRAEGRIAESTQMFQACAKIHTGNAESLKQIARNLFLIGKYKNSIECYRRAADISQGGDWEIPHHLGVCYLHLKQYEAAEKSLHDALEQSKQDVTFSTLARLYLETNRMDKAVETMKKGIDFSPENINLLTTLGLLYLRMQDFHRAFELLGQAMTFDPENYKAILAAGSLMQVHGDYDVALTKYRVAAQKAPESAALWNNIAMCFFGKKKYVAAMSCLKRATYLAPFDWKILYNLSLLHCTMQQYASAFQFASSALKLKPKSGALFMLLGVALNHLGDAMNAKKSYEQAIELQPDDLYTVLNYVTFLQQSKDLKNAQKYFSKLDRMIEVQNSDSGVDKEILEMAKKLGAALHVGDRHIKHGEERHKSSSKSHKKRDSKGKELVPSVSPLTKTSPGEPASMTSSSTDKSTPGMAASTPMSPAGSLPPLKPRQPLPSLEGPAQGIDMKPLNDLPEVPSQPPERLNKRTKSKPDSVAE